MVRPIRDINSGKFKGSIGDGKLKPPTITPSKPGSNSRKDHPAYGNRPIPAPTDGAGNYRLVDAPSRHDNLRHILEANRKGVVGIFSSARPTSDEISQEAQLAVTALENSWNEDIAIAESITKLLQKEYTGRRAGISAVTSENEEKLLAQEEFRLRAQYAAEALRQLELARKLSDDDAFTVVELLRNSYNKKMATLISQTNSSDIEIEFIADVNGYLNS